MPWPRPPQPAPPPTVRWRRKHHKELFGKIVDMSIADSELDTLAKKLDGSRSPGGNAVKSTGSAGRLSSTSRPRKGETLPRVP